MTGGRSRTTVHPSPKDNAEVTLDIASDWVDITPRSIPDLSWRFEDAKGHKHKWTPRDKKNQWAGADCKTVEWVEDEPGYDPDTGDEIPRGHSACRRCGEEIVLGYCAPDGQHYICTSIDISGEVTYRYKVPWWAWRLECGGTTDIKRFVRNLKGPILIVSMSGANPRRRGPDAHRLLIITFKGMPGLKALRRGKWVDV